MPYIISKFPFQMWSFTEKDSSLTKNYKSIWAFLLKALRLQYLKNIIKNKYIKFTKKIHVLIWK